MGQFRPDLVNDRKEKSSHVFRHFEDADAGVRPSGCLFQRSIRTVLRLSGPAVLLPQWWVHESVSIVRRGDRIEERTGKGTSQSGCSSLLDDSYVDPNFNNVHVYGHLDNLLHDLHRNSEHLVSYSPFLHYVETIVTFYLLSQLSWSSSTRYGNKERSRSLL